MEPDPTSVVIRFAKKWKKLPPGWTDKSVEKFWKTLGKGTPEHKVWNCIEKMDKPFGDGAGAFCGGLADWQMPGWRKKNKKESPEARSDAKSYWKGKIKKKDKKALTSASAASVALRFAARSNKQVIEDRKHHTTRAASTNTERYFYKATDDKWYVENEGYEEDWDTGEQVEGEMTHYGPFPSFDAAYKYMRRNFANSGGYSTDKSGRMKPPRKPVSPRGPRWAFNSGPLMLQPDYGHGDAAVPGDEEYHPCQHGGPCQCGGGCGCGK